MSFIAGLVVLSVCFGVGKFHEAIVVTCRCRRCNRKLKNPESIARGIGDTCRRKAVGRRVRRRREWLQLELFLGPVQLELFADHSVA